MGNLHEKWEIQELLNQYMYAVDRPDLKTLRRIFDKKGTLRSSDQVFTADDFVDVVRRMKRTVKVSMHHLSNTVIAVHGDTAEAKSYYYAIHRVPGGVDSLPFGRFDQDTDVIMAGRYEDRLRKTDDGWKLVERHSFIEWENWSPAREKSTLSDLSRSEPGVDAP